MKLKVIIDEQKNTGTLFKKNYEWIRIKEVIVDETLHSFAFQIGKKYYAITTLIYPEGYENPEIIK